MLVLSALCSIYLYHCSYSLREKSPNTGKYGPEKTPYLGTFHGVIVIIMEAMYLLILAAIIIVLLCHKTSS